MTVFFKKLIKFSSPNLFKRYLHFTTLRQSYEGEGKTTVTLLNNNYDYGLMIDTISQYGFILNNGIRVVGPMVIFPKTTLSWNIASSPSMNEASFSLLLNLEPKLDILVIGLDDEYPYNAPFLLNIKDLFKKYDIQTEILSVQKACSTFNFLNAENRYAAAALIPPRLIYAENVLLQRPNQPKVIKSDDKESKYIDLDKDPLSPTDSEDIDGEILRKQKETANATTLRSSWKPDIDKSKKKSNYIDFDKDPVIPNDSEDIDGEILRKQKEAAKALRVRSPWKPESTSDYTNKKTKK